jgi:hypothetical protein
MGEASRLFLGLSSLLFACSPSAFPDGARNEYEAERILARCETAAKPKTYYEIIPVDQIYLERPRDEFGLGIWGFSVNGSVRRDRPAKVGLRQGKNQQLALTDGLPRPRQAFLLYTGEHPEEMPAVRVHTETRSGEVVAMTRVNQCDLLHTKYVTFDGRADVALDVRERERGDFTQTIRVSAKAKRSRNGAYCGGQAGAGVLLLPGQKARVASIEGGARYGTFHRDFYGPAGTPGRWQSYRYDDLGGMNHGALIVQTPHSVATARVGDRIEADKVTCVSFFINDTDTDNNKGAFEVTLDVEDEG